MERISDPNRLRSGSQSSDENAIWYMGATGQDNALAIVGGVQAWKVLTNGKGPLWRKFNREEMSRRSSKEAAEDGSQEKDPLPPNHTQAEQDHPENVDCPFTAMAHLGEQQENDAEALEVQRPVSLPTPPPTQEHYIKKPPYRHPQDTNAASPPPSISGSASKCPIRLLDERSPEEVAEYFETHKHEVPRSHEICVKRYQSNAQSIRLLDAKYGNLVNMLQGLGIKHQPLLRPHEETESVASMDSKSVEKVEKWADNVEETPVEGQAPNRHSLPDTEERQAHFDRPLKEIRVGESPSRPWGIPMLGTGPSKSHSEGEDLPTIGKSGTKVDQNTSHPQAQTKQVPPEGRGYQPDNEPGMVFTGPVFIGYGAEQAAALIQKCGWDPNGPSK